MINGYPHSRNTQMIYNSRYIILIFGASPQIATPPPFGWTSAAETAWRRGSAPPLRGFQSFLSMKNHGKSIGL